MAKIKDKDIKLLWARAGGICSFCKCKVSENSTLGDDYITGEQAHIIGEKEGSARYKSNLSLDERNSYNNLILLCPTCHTKIDKSEHDFTVEKLLYIKSQHERELEQANLKFENPQIEAEKEFYDHLISTTFELCSLENWNSWVTDLCSTNIKMNCSQVEKIGQFNSEIFSANFMNVYPEIEKSIKTLNLILHNLLKIYLKFAEKNDFYYVTSRFYRNHGNFNHNYDKDLELYNKWEQMVTDLCFEATKAINWFAESIRKDINPRFFNIEGQFKIILGPFMFFDYKEYIPKFTPDEKASLPDSYKEFKI